MKKFIFKILILIIPFVLTPLLVLNLSGELMPIQDVVNLSIGDSHQVLYGAVYSTQTIRYKLLSTLNNRPNVIVLGTSRVMQFRRNFFSDDVVFYNAGGGIQKIENFSLFLKQIPTDATPKIILMGLDQNFFNQAWIDAYVLQPGYEERLLKDISVMDIIRPNMAIVWQDIFKGKLWKHNLYVPSGEYKLIGLNAMKNYNGFRDDGSYLYGKIIGDPNNPQNLDYSYGDTFARIASGNERFEYGVDLSPMALKELDLFLDECDSRGIRVVGFLPPYAGAVYQKMETMPEQYAYMHKIMPTITPMFEKHGFTVFDFSNLATIGATDAETIDGFHGSEKAYLRLFIIMAKNDPVLLQFSADLDYLMMRLNETQNDFIVFDD